MDDNASRWEDLVGCARQRSIYGWQCLVRCAPDLAIYDSVSRGVLPTWLSMTASRPVCSRLGHLWQRLARCVPSLAIYDSVSPGVFPAWLSMTASRPVCSQLGHLWQRLVRCAPSLAIYDSVSCGVLPAWLSMTASRPVCSGCGNGASGMYHIVTCALDHSLSELFVIGVHKLFTLLWWRQNRLKKMLAVPGSCHTTHDWTDSMLLSRYLPTYVNKRHMTTQNN